MIGVLGLLVWWLPPCALMSRPEALQIDGVPYAVPAAFAWWLIGSVLLLAIATDGGRR